MTLLDEDSTARDTIRPDAIDEPVTCTRVEEVTHDVKTFVLSRAGGSGLAFAAGQYLTVAVEVDGAVQHRCYTISASPSADELAITVKRVPGGPMSNWLHDRLTVGDRIQVAGPYGRFTLDEHPASRYLFLSAGSGITPLMSMTRMLHDGAAPVGPLDVVFVHSARTPADIVFRRELETIGARPGFSVTVVCEGAAPGESWDGPIGRVSLRTLLRVAPDLHDREVFTCGPVGYMESVREALALAGVDPARCHEESFVLGSGTTRSSEAAAVGRTQTLRRQVEFRRSGRTIACAADETLLAAALRAGLRLPSMCTEGVCGTCRTRLLAGDVDMRDAGGIRQREIDRGDVLICCSTPRGDVVLDA